MRLPRGPPANHETVASIRVARDFGLELVGVMIKCTAAGGRGQPPRGRGRLSDQAESEPD
jgi:hypothetical protein